MIFGVTVSHSRLLLPLSSPPVLPTTLQASPLLLLVCQSAYLHLPLFIPFPESIMGANLSKALGSLPFLCCYPRLTLAFARNLAKLFSNKEMRLLMLGLDAAGKTSGWTAFLSRYLCPERPRSDLIQAQTKPVRNDHPDRFVAHTLSSSQAR